MHCVVAEDAHDLDDMVDRAGSIAFRDGFAKAGQRVIIVAGVPLGAPGTTNMLRIASVGPNGDADDSDASSRSVSKPTARERAARNQPLQRGVERDLGVEQFRHRTSGLRLAGQFLERRVVGARGSSPTASDAPR